MKEEEKDILSAFVSGNQRETNQAIDLMYKRYFDIIEYLVLNNSGNASDVDDLFQEVLVVFYRNVQLGKFQGNSSIQTYFYAIARNIWMTQIKKNSVLKVTSVENISDDDHPVEHEVASNFSKETEEMLTKLLSEMNEGCKKILTDFYYKKMSLDDIKKSYQLASKQVAKTKKYRCLKKLITTFNSKRSLIELYN